MSLFSLLREQWANVTGAAASVSLFIYNVFKPVKIPLLPQSALGDAVAAHPVGISLGAVAFIGFCVFALLFAFKGRRKRSR